MLRLHCVPLSMTREHRRKNWLRCENFISHYRITRINANRKRNGLLIFLLHHLTIPPRNTYHHAEAGEGLDEVEFILHPMELARHAGERTVNHTDHLAGLGLGIVLGHDVGVAEVGVAQGTELDHLLIRHLAPLGGVFLAEGVAGDGTFFQQLHQVTLAVVLLQKNEVVDHRGQHTTRIAFPVGLLDIHHGNEMMLAFLGQELADFQLLTVERTKYVPDGGRHRGN